MATTPLLLVELNEVNFEFVEHYARRGELPVFARLFAEHGYQRTVSEDRYEHIEPWIQWATVHTGLPFSRHGIFRLGDGARTPHDQIWETLEKGGRRVGAFSPMNAGNRLTKAAFFVPDPWTQTGVSAPAILRRAYEAVCAAVGDNAEGRLGVKSALALAAGLAAYARPRNWPAYLRDAFRGLRSHWPRAIFLDRFLADCFLRLWRRTQPDFASLFLNGAAHIQHHYLFNSAVYRGPYSNPDWYLAPGVDPVLEIYRLYDGLLGELLALEPRPRLMLATGLHQDPVDKPVFYWRLRDHASFLRALGCEFKSVEPLMSRDFLVRCADADQAAASAARLASGRAADDAPLFEVDNRGESLFVTLSYPGEIRPGDAARFDGHAVPDFAREVVFVAIKNGHHNGIGYFLDTGAPRQAAMEPFSLADIHDRVIAAL